MYVGSDWLIIFVFIFSNTKSTDIYRTVILFLSTCICLFIDFLHHVLSLPLLQRAFTAKAAGEKKKPPYHCILLLPSLHGDIPILAHGLVRAVNHCRPLL